MNQRIKFLLCAALTLGPIQTLLAAELGDPIPDCALTGDAAGYRLKQFQGKVLYVDFWASWCDHCAKSFPFMNNLDREFKDQGLQIIGVNVDENPADAQDFLAKFPADFIVAADTQGQCATSFGVKAMPSSYLIDRKGRIHHIHLGFRTEDAEELKALVAQLLAER